MQGQKNTTIKIELNLTRKTTKDWWNCKKKKCQNHLKNSN
jgi:hypothetical protein